MLPSVALSKLCSTTSNPLILEGMVDPNHQSQQEASSYTEATAMNTGRSTTQDSVVSNQDTQQLSQPAGLSMAVPTAHLQMQERLLSVYC